MRKPIVAANWKMHKTPSETEAFLEKFIKKARKIENVEIVLAPTFTSLALAGDYVQETEIKLCAQNTHYEEEGAFTGEVSPPMLVELGCEYVIVGHSERRNIFGETDELVNKKLRSVLAHGMKPILCIGESKEERSKGNTEKILADQLERGLANLTEGDLEKLTIAYEPIWAIGTGESASPEDAQKGCEFARNKIAELADGEAAEKVRLQYGGSIKPHNAEDLMSQRDLDGGLIGSASLQPESFYQIIKITEEIR